MTPKEKAIELVDRLTFRCFECDYEGNAKQSALISVDETIHYLEIILGVDKEDFEFWQEVKKELEKL